MPSTTGSTASRWLGFDARLTTISLPAGDWCLPDAPTWYFTSPEPWADIGSSSPSNSRKICSYDLPTTLASTLSRPRCAIPSTVSGNPESAAAESTESSIGITVSAPSRLNRLWPRYLVCRKRSKASAALSRSRIAPLVVEGQLGVDALDLVLDPRLLLGLLDVHVLDADRARVRVAAGCP